MCAGLCPTYWITFGIAERNRNGSCPMHEWDHPPFFEFLTPPPPARNGPIDPKEGRGTSADIVRKQIKYGVNTSTRCWDIAQKPPKCKKCPLTPIVTKISFPPSPPGAANPQKGRRHTRNQNTPACKHWRESARGLSRNRWPNKKNRKTYSKTNTSSFGLTSEWRVKTEKKCFQSRLETVHGWRDADGAR